MTPPAYALSFDLLRLTAPDGRLVARLTPGALTVTEARAICAALNVTASNDPLDRALVHAVRERGADLAVKSRQEAGIE